MSSKNYSPACKHCGGEDCICCEIYQDSLYDCQDMARNYDNRYDDPFGRYARQDDEAADEPHNYWLLAGRLYKPAKLRRGAAKIRLAFR